MTPGANQKRIYAITLQYENQFSVTVMSYDCCSKTNQT